MELINLLTRGAAACGAAACNADGAAGSFARSARVAAFVRVFCAALVCWGVLLGSEACWATPTFDPPNPDVIEFDGEVVELSTVGLRVGVPRGGESMVQTIAGRVTAGVTLPDGLGSVLVQARETGNSTMSVLDLEKAVLRRTLFRSLTDERIEITIDLLLETDAGISLGRSPALPSAGRIVRPFYVRLKEDSPQPMRGFGVIPLGADSFVLYQLFCSDEAFERSRHVFELMLKSATLQEGESIDAEREPMILSGAEILGLLGPADYTAIITDFPDQFERIYRPAPGGAATDEEEVGYRRIRAWRGSIADLETGVADAGGPKDGYVLRVDGSVLLDDEFGGTSTAKSRAVYFLSEDRRRESWKVDMSISSEGRTKPEVWSEIGMRLDDSMSVQITNSKRDSSTIRPSIRGEGYISRLESYILPQLLIRAGKEGEFAFYAYDQTAELNRLRTVTAARATDRPGLWRITTVLSSEQEEAAEFNEYGRLIRSETTEGVVKRPIEFERLRSIWRSKGLSLD